MTMDKKDSIYNRLGGYTLIEVMISISIIAIGMISISKLTISVIRANNLNQQGMIALSLVQNKIEEFKRIGYARLEEGTFEDTGIKEIKLAWDIKRDTPVNGTAIVTVSSKWSLGDREKNLQIETIIGK